MVNVEADEAIGPGRPAMMSMMKQTTAWPTAARWLPAMLVAAVLAGSSDAADPLRIDQLQLLGTHNSYHIAPDRFAMTMLSAVAGSRVTPLDCSHRPLTDQLEAGGLRHFEFDCYLDPEGTLFGSPLVIRLADAAGAEVPAFDPQGRLARPGIKLLHSPDVDVRTTSYTLHDALTDVKTWSDAHPEHVPLFFLLELKSDSFTMTRPLPWEGDAFASLEREIIAVWPRERIITPADVQGAAATLRDAVAGRGWPPVDAHRGKGVFLLDNEGALRDRYLAATAKSRLLFVSVDRDHPEAAWMKRNDPVRHEAEIRRLVEDGFLVRTRADANSHEARANDPRRRDLAITSGAQLISTDYPEPDLRLSDYCVTLPDPPEPRSD